MTETLGAGDSLPTEPRAQFEGALGRDLSHVRVHTDDKAERLTSLFGARAFAAGGDIAFAKGEYDPHSREGKHLLAHEVAHTAQQRNAVPGGREAQAGEVAHTAQQRNAASGGGQAQAGELAATQPGELAATQPGELATTRPGALATTQPGDAAETNADAAASAMVAGKPAQVSAEPMSIARRTKDEPRAPSAGGDAGTSADAKTTDGKTTDGKDAEGEEIGELTADRVGQEPDEETVAPVVPPHDLEGGKRELVGANQQAAQQGGGEDVGGGGLAGAGASGGGAEVGAAPGDGGGVSHGGVVGGSMTDGGGAVGGGASGGGVAAGAGAEGDGAAGAGAEGGGAGAGAGAGEGGAGGGIAASIAEAQNDAREAASAAEAESTAYKADMAARRERFDAEQQALATEQLKTMSATDKRATLADLGYDPKKVAQLKDTELDGIITGKLEAEQNKTKILGMTPEELAKLSPAQKQKFLVDLGIDRADLDKAGQAKTDKLFDDVTRAAHIPGMHKVKIQIKGGLFGKSWVVTVKCDADGGVDAQAQKEGGFLSKLVGWIKAALPILLTVIAPITGGASLIALSVYQTVVAIKTGNWLGAITGAASALVGLGAIKAIAQGTGGLAQALVKVAGVAGKVKNVAAAAQAAMIAAKAKNAGSLLAALSAGAAAFAGFASNEAGKFAQTMMRWSERLKKWSQVVGGSEKVLKGIESGDAVAAIGGALDTAGALVGTGKPTEKTLQRVSSITTCIAAGRRALQSNPPNYEAVADAALGIAAQLTQDRRVADAQRLVGSANRLKQAWAQRASNPAGVAEAALGLAEAIQLAKYDLEHDEKDADGKATPEAERAAIVARYQRSTRVVKAAGSLLTAASARPHPNYSAALDAAAQLVAEFTDDKRLDAAAVVTSKLDAWTKAVNKGDQQGILAASLALFQAVDGLRDAIDEERAKSRQEAEAKLPPGEKLPDDGAGGVPRVPAPPQEPAPVGPGDLTVPGSGVPLASGLGGGAGSAPSTPGQAPSSPTTPGSQPAPSGTTPSGTTPGTGKPAELPQDAKTIIAIIKVFADLAAQFEHPTAKKLIAEWDSIRKQAEALSSDKPDADAYDKVLAALRLIKSDARFFEVVAKEFSTWESKFRDPLDEPAVRRELQAFGQFTRNLGRLVRVAAIPETFEKAADDLVVVCGFDKSLSGAPSTVTQRLAAAADLGKQVAALPGELAWLGRIAQTVLTKLGGGSAVAAINAARVAANKLGADIARVIMRWVTPVLEKIAATEGGAAAVRAGEKVAVVLAEWGVSLSGVASKPAFRVAANFLGERLGVALRFGTSLPVAIAVEIGRLEMQFASQLFEECYASFSHGLSERLFGKTIHLLTEEIRGKPDSTPAACDAFFRYASRTMLSGAVSRVSSIWASYVVAHLPPKTDALIATWPARFSAQPFTALEKLDPPDLKMIVAAMLKDVAYDFLKEEYRKEFKEDP